MQARSSRYLLDNTVFIAGVKPSAKSLDAQKEIEIMIIQKVIKGIGGIKPDTMNNILRTGITCRWWQEVNPLPNVEIPLRLTERNLVWHQNRYDYPDPQEENRPFYSRTPFISTTAGTIERDTFYQTNILQPAWVEALRFATDGWSRDGYLFYCYVFIIGKKSVGHQLFAEEIRELNIYAGFSPFQPEGEIAAKIIIPTAQIEKAEYWPIDKLLDDLKRGQAPSPEKIFDNPLYLPPEDYNNVRDVLA
jgi:hypothetical protein